MPHAMDRLLATPMMSPVFPSSNMAVILTHALYFAHAQRIAGTGRDCAEALSSYWGLHAVVWEKGQLLSRLPHDDARSARSIFDCTAFIGEVARAEYPGGCCWRAHSWGGSHGGGNCRCERNRR